MNYADKAALAEQLRQIAEAVLPFDPRLSAQIVENAVNVYLLKLQAERPGSAESELPPPPVQSQP